VFCRFSFSQHAVPAAGARVFRLSYRAAYGAAGDHDDRVCAVVGAPGRELRNAAVSTGRGRRFYAEHTHADRVGPTHLGWMACGHLRAFWRGPGNGQSCDQQQRCGWNAIVASGRSSGHRFDQPAGGLCNRRCSIWNGSGNKSCARHGFQHGDPRDLVGDDRMRRNGASAGVCVKHYLGASKHGTDSALA